MSRAVIPALALLLAALPAVAVAGQSSGKPPPAAQAKPRVQLDREELERIREAINREPAIRIREGQVRFYVRVEEEAPTYAEIVKNYDLKHGPVPGAGMTHGEFLNMVTPKELYGPGGIRAGEALQMAVTGLVGQMLVKKAFESVTDAWRARQIREINERIDAELAALRRRDR